MCSSDLVGGIIGAIGGGLATGSPQGAIVGYNLGKQVGTGAMGMASGDAGDEQIDPGNVDKLQSLMKLRDKKDAIQKLLDEGKISQERYDELAAALGM